MGTLVGHVAPGFGFFIIGLWHLFKNIKLHILHPSSYISLPWFPTSKIRHLELFLIMVASTLSIAMELFIGPRSHQPLDKDFTIPSNHLHNFEHASISATFFIYAFFSILLDRFSSNAHLSLSQLLAGVTFAQQLLVFHLHSADHMGTEGQYHMLLQIIIFVSLSTNLLGIGYPNSFLVSFVRSVSILFQGFWLMVMGFMLWTSQIIPKGCFLNMENGHQVVRCGSDEALHRAKSLVNIEFSWSLIGVTIFAISFYLWLIKLYQDKGEYKIQEEEDDGIDVEDQKESKFREWDSFLHMGKSFAAIDMERLKKLKEGHIMR